jgi:phosphoribosylamine--glycine ligase
MGDPECQTILPKLKTDLFEIFLSCSNGTLAETEIEWHNKKSLCVVVCSKGYPEKFKNEILIANIEKLDLTENDFIYHASTKRIKNQIYSNGGRVINFVSLSSNFKKSRDTVLELIKNLNWTEGFFRKDIGHKVIDE